MNKQQQFKLRKLIEDALWLAEQKGYYSNNPKNSAETLKKHDKAGIDLLKAKQAIYKEFCRETL